MTNKPPENQKCVFYSVIRFMNQRDREFIQRLMNVMNLLSDCLNNCYYHFFHIKDATVKNIH